MKNYNRPFRNFIFWSVYDFFSYFQHYQIYHSICMLSDNDLKYPIRLRIWFFKKFIEEKLISTFAFFTCKNNANFKSKYSIGSTICFLVSTNILERSLIPPKLEHCSQNEHPWHHFQVDSRIRLGFEVAKLSRIYIWWCID